MEFTHTLSRGSRCPSVFSRNRALPGGSESDRFQANPLAFLRGTYGTVVGMRGGSTPTPNLAVIYSTHFGAAGVAEFLGTLGLEPVQVVFNAHVNGDADSDDTHKSVVVLERAACLPRY